MLHSVGLDYPRFGKTYGVIGEFVGGLEIENGPDRAGTIAELYDGQERPALLVRLLNDKVQCETLDEYVLMDDPAVAYLTPKAGI